MSFLSTGVCVIGLLSIFLLGRSLYQLRPNQNDILHLIGARRLRLAMSALLIGPPVVVSGLAVIVLFILQDQLFLRATHILLVLGLWMVLSLSCLVMFVITRLGHQPSINTLAAAVLSVPLVAYLTPLDRFSEVFQPAYFYIPMATGVLMLVACYLLILIARRDLLHAPAG